MAIRDFSLTVILADLRPLLEILNIGREKLDVNGYWGASLLAFNLEEALVKKKLREMGVPESEMQSKFHILLKKTIHLIEEKESRRLSNEILLATGYRNIRNKLVHEGHRWKPTQKEAGQIVVHLLKLAEELWKPETA